MIAQQVGVVDAVWIRMAKFLLCIHNSIWYLCPYWSGDYGFLKPQIMNFTLPYRRAMDSHLLAMPRVSTSGGELR